MSRAPAASTVDVAASGWAENAIPWLMSASMHCVLLIILGLCAARGAFSNSGTTTGSDLTGTVFASQAASDYYDDDGPSLGALDGDLRDVPPTDARQASGDPNASDSNGPSEPGDGDTGGATGGGAGGSGGPLASVLGGKPPIDFSGVLPSATAVLGGGALEGGGVGTAKTATTGSQGSKNLQGGYARTGVFGVQAQGYKFVYVFDRSGSMGGHGGAPLAAAQTQLIASLKNLGQTHQFQIIFYNERPHIFNPTGSPGRLVFGTDANKYQAEQFVQSITADGATQHEDALALALRMAPDVIFFLTDADEPRLNAGQLAHIARLNKGTSINAIEFGFGAQEDAENFLVRLRARTAASTSTSISRSCRGPKQQTGREPQRHGATEGKRKREIETRRRKEERTLGRCVFRTLCVIRPPVCVSRIKHFYCVVWSSMMRHL